MEKMRFITWLKSLKILGGTKDMFKQQEIKTVVKVNGKVCCPKCGSTNFSTKEREFNKTLGSAIANQGGVVLVTRYTEFTCLKCGEKFKAGK